MWVRGCGTSMALLVMHLDLAEHSVEKREIASHEPATLTMGRVGSGQWGSQLPSSRIDAAAPQETGQATLTKKQGATRTASTQLPASPTGSILPIRTGAGYTYLFSPPITNAQAMHIFQTPSSPKTAAFMKGTIRDKASGASSALPDSCKSGKHEWSIVEAAESTKQDGAIKRPNQDLTELRLLTGKNMVIRLCIGVVEPTAAAREVNVGLSVLIRGART